jgi:hypothetical protein
MEPSLAVDLNMLECVNELFVCSRPNTTAWCATLEAFLGNHKYKLKTRVSGIVLGHLLTNHQFNIQDSLCHQFGNALHWYAALINAKELLVQSHLEDARANVLHNDKLPENDGRCHSTSIYPSMNREV